MLVCAFGSGAANAFGTINAAGQNAEHEKITRAALPFLGAATLDALAGKKGTFGAVGAPDKPGRGLLSDSAAHCDNGDFLDVPSYPQSKATAQATLTACRDAMFASFERAVDLAGALATPSATAMKLGCAFDGKTGSAKCRVLDSMGLVLHSAQDFYSHTNWTDRAAPGAISAANPPGLAREGPAPFINPAAGGFIPDGLISGCFVSKPESAFCNYGGAGPIASKDRVKHAALNKDAGPIGKTGATGKGTSDRGGHSGNFERAVSAAIADTRVKWDLLEARIRETYGAEAGARIICALRSDKVEACQGG